MSFLKKIIVLKQLQEGFSLTSSPVSAILRVEIEEEVATLFLSPVNFSYTPKGEYFLFVLDKDNILFDFSLLSKPSSTIRNFYRLPNLNDFCACICHVKDNFPIFVCYQRSENSSLSLQDIKKSVADWCIERRKNLRPKKEEDDKRPLRPIGRAGSHMTTSDCSVLLLVVIISHTIVKVNTKQYDKKRPKRKTERLLGFFFICNIQITVRPVP